MTRAFNIEGLVRLQNYMGGKTLSDAQFFAVLNADVVEMIDGEESTTKRRYFRIAENDESITFSCILGSSQQQMVVTKGSKQLNVTTTEIGGTIAPGSITSEMLADKAVTRRKLDNAAVGSEALGNASVTSVKINAGAVTSEKLAHGSVTSEGLADDAVTVTKLASGAVIMDKIATGAITSIKIAAGAITSEKLAHGLDVSGLFFILPEGTQFPYTLTEEDKTKLANAKFLVCVSRLGSIMVLSHPITSSYVGSWFGIYSSSSLLYAKVTKSAINEPSTIAIVDSNSVRFNNAQTLTAEQKLQARTNIGAAEDTNTSGDSQATLEEPPVADEKTIP